jgi:hypothetical protein
MKNKDQVKVTTKRGCPIKKTRENQRKYDERRLKDTMSLVNGSDPKSLEL